MPKCKSPPFFILKNKIREQKKEEEYWVDLRKIYSLKFLPSSYLSPFLLQFSESTRNAMPLL